MLPLVKELAKAEKRPDMLVKRVYPADAGTFSALADCGTPSVYPAGAGTLAPEIFMIIGIRFIPAGAGTLHIPENAWVMIRFIPLAREHGLTDDDFKISDGLSPLARGTRI